MAFENVVVPGPAVCVHVPVPLVTVLPASVAARPQIACVAPAFEIVGKLLTATVVVPTPEVQPFVVTVRL